jgi:hypothetical protein
MMPDHALSVVLARKQVFRGDWPRLARQKREEPWALLASPHVVQQMSAESRAVFDRVDVLVDPADGAWRDRVMLLAEGAAIAHIATNDEYCVVIAGELRDQLGCAGPGAGASRAYADKLEMKTLAARAGIRVPYFSSAPAQGDALGDLVGELRQRTGGGPVVVKPVRGSNSRDVVVIGDGCPSQGVERGSWAAGPYQVEEFVAGDIFFCDAMIGDDGHATPLMFGEYLNPPLGFAAGLPHGSISLPPDGPVAESLWAHNALVLQALPEVRGTVTHTELIREQRTGEWVLLETAARAPGAYVARCGEVVVGQNLEELHMATQLGLPRGRPTATGQHAAWVWYRRRPGKVREVRQPTLAAASELVWTVSPGDEVLDLPMDGNSEVHAALTVVLSGSYEVVRGDFETLRAFDPVVMCAR